jgi:hypothetical protein
MYTGFVYTIKQDAFFCGCCFAIKLTKHANKQICIRKINCHSHTYYNDIRSTKTELITQLHVYNNVTRSMNRQWLFI